MLGGKACGQITKINNMKSILKWTLFTILVLLAIGSCKIRSELRHLSGENTPIVDPSQFKTLSGQLAITNVNVLASDAQSILKNQTVLIKDSLIDYVGNETKVPSGFQIIDGTNKFLIPGLVDSHVHGYKSKNDLLLYLANGITHVAYMNSWRGTYLEWREDLKKDNALSPQIYIAAGPMSTERGFKNVVKSWFGPIPVYNSPAKARKAVKKFKAHGYDAIKSYTLEKEVYVAVSDATKDEGIEMAGHISSYVDLEDIYRSNQSQIAHVEEITKAVERQFGGRRKIYYDSTQAYLSYLREHADEIAQKLKEQNIVVSTTAIVYTSAKQQDLDLPKFLKSIELKYVNPGIVEGSVYNPGWLPGSNQYENPLNTDSAGVKRAELYWDTYIEAVNIMTLALVSNGVTVTAGTDANVDGIVPGFSLHDELEYLSKIGLSNAQVLKSATIASAKWLENNAGKIEKGRIADLVLLNENPLDDIRNTRNINAVITRGKYLNRTELDKILASIVAANDRVRRTSIAEYLK